MQGVNGQGCKTGRQSDEVSGVSPVRNKADVDFKVFNAFFAAACHVSQCMGSVPAEGSDGGNIDAGGSTSDICGSLHQV